MNIVFSLIISLNGVLSHSPDSNRVCYFCINNGFENIIEYSIDAVSIDSATTYFGLIPSMENGLEKITIIEEANFLKFKEDSIWQNLELVDGRSIVLKSSGCIVSCKETLSLENIDKIFVIELRQKKHNRSFFYQSYYYQSGKGIIGIEGEYCYLLREDLISEKDSYLSYFKLLK